MEIPKPTRNNVEVDRLTGGLFLCPKVMGELYHTSWRFYDDYHDLLPKAYGQVAQVGWGADDGPRVVSETDRPIVSLSFSAEKHVENECMTGDGGGRNKFHGPGRFAWQVVCANQLGRGVVQLELQGPNLLRFEGRAYSPQGSVQAQYRLGGAAVWAVKRVIETVTQHDIFLDDVTRLRNDRARAVRELADLLFRQHEFNHRHFKIMEDRTTKKLAKQGFVALPFIDLSNN